VRSEPKPSPIPFVTGALSIAFLLAIIDRMIFSLLITPIKVDLGISDTQAGALAGLAFGLFYTLFGLPLGRLADRTHRPRLITAGVLLWTIATIACGFAQSFEQLFVARVCVGVGEAAISPAAYSLLADYVPRRKLARALSIYMMGTVVGVAVAWIAGGRIIHLVERSTLPWPFLKPWSIVFFAAGAPGLIIAPMLLAIREIRPARDQGKKEKTRLRDVWQQLLEGRIAYAGHFTGVAALNTYAFAVLTWSPTMFTREFGWQLDRTGLTLGLAVGAAGLTGMYAVGALADRLVSAGRAAASYELMLWIAAAMLPFACLESLSHGPLERLSIFLVPTMTLFFMLVSCSPTAIQLITPAPLRGTISAVYLFVVNVTAYSIGPLSVGLLADLHKGDPAGLKGALETLGLICAPLAVIAFGAGLRSFYRLTKLYSSCEAVVASFPLQAGSRQ
jgi:MFS family permease